MLTFTDNNCNSDSTMVSENSIFTGVQHFHIELSSDVISDPLELEPIHYNRILLSLTCLTALNKGVVKLLIALHVRFCLVCISGSNAFQNAFQIHIVETQRKSILNVAGKYFI